MTDLELAAYLDHGLAEPDRTRVERHLADCPLCRQQLLETRGLIDRVNRPRRIFRVSAALAAAVAAILLVNPALMRRGFTRGELVRSESSTVGLTAYGPSGEVARSGLRFVWASAPSALSYRVTISDASGSAAWTASTSDTTIALPDSVRLAAAQTYYWVSDAVTSDGRTPSTGLKEFTIRQ